ncbi:MAG: homoserine kinase [Solirubrobacterales bacterium]|nr:homoserine kinase [Solirubrobacterales bacterium]
MTAGAGGCRVRVPGSTANLGPGLDVMAAALSLWLELEVTAGEAFAVDTELDVPHDRDNLVVRAFERLAPADGHRFRIVSQIPMSGGLGSSATAIVAGLLAADHLSGTGADIQALATELEGHPDNIAASLRGGIVICEGPRVHRLEPPAWLSALLVVPGDAVLTADARAALPVAVPLADAVFNVASAATLTLGLARGDWSLVAAGLRDRLHQPPRARLYPRSAALLARAGELGALGATISGAGPTVLVWCRGESVGAVRERLVAEVEGWAIVVEAAFASAGAVVEDQALA